MKTINFRKYIVSAILAALVFIFTALAPKIPLPMGYYHIGDAFIYICACILPAPFCLFSASIGACLADIFTGYILYAPFTFFIKAFMAYLFTSKQNNLLCKRNYLSSIFAGIINVIGYYISEVVILAFSSKALNFSVFISPFYSIPYNLIQSAASAVIFIIIAAALDKASIKSKIIF